MIFDAPPGDPYLRYCQRVLLRGESVALPIDPETEPSNVHSLALARTRKCIEIMRKRGWA